jgi:hypothetical protein
MWLLQIATLSLFFIVPNLWKLYEDTFRNETYVRIVYFTWSLISFCWWNLSIMLHLSPLEKDLLILLTNILYKTPSFSLGYLQKKNLEHLEK